MSSSTATFPNISPSVGPGQPVYWAPRPQLYQHSSSLTALEGGTLSGRPSKVMTVDDAGKRRNEELNILLVIVGLLAATITSFVIYIQPQLQESSADDATALLRVLVYTATNGSLPGSGPHPTLPTWSGAPATLLFAQFALYACLGVTLLCGLYAMLIKFLTDSNALNWKNKIVDCFTRWVFFVIYLLLSGVFFWLFVALILQIPLLPSVTTLRIVKKLGGKA